MEETKNQSFFIFNFVIHFSWPKKNSKSAVQILHSHKSHHPTFIGQNYLYLIQIGQPIMQYLLSSDQLRIENKKIIDRKKLFTNYLQ